jgi:hypothetical protein
MTTLQRFAEHQVVSMALYRTVLSAMFLIADFGQTVCGGLSRFLSRDAIELTAYVTEKTVDGLFLMLAEHEKQLRENPLARPTELLEHLFGPVSP